MATIIDALIVTLKLDNTGFKEETRKSTAESDRLSASLDNVNESSADLTITIKNQADETKKAKEKTEDFTKSINNGIKALTAFFGTIMVSSGLAKLITDVNQANDKLNFLSKNLGMNATEVKKWQNMAEMAGGTTDGMTASLSNLSKSLWDLVTIGDASVLPYFNALNVGVVDSTGNIRNLDDILLDVSDSLSKMSRPQAYNIAKNMGFDEGTINTLLQGRDAMERQLAAQKDIVISSKEELEISRKLNEQNALVSKQWEGLKTLIANYLTPYFLKFSERLTAWLDYLGRNRETAILLFKGIATIIGLTLIPLALKAAMAFAGMFAPLLTGVGIIALLGTAIFGLFNDYEVWKRGGKSMFDWSEWSASIETVLGWLDQISKWFKDTKIGKWFTDQDGNLNGWKLALGGFATWFSVKWAASLLATLGKVSKGIAGVGAAAGRLSTLAKGAGMVGATYVGADLLDSGLNKAFGDTDYFQRIRTAPTWDAFWSALSGGGDAGWLNGEWVDNRGKGKGLLLSNDTLGIPTGNTTRDSLAARVSRGEVSLDEANGLLGSGTTPLMGNSRGERNNNPLNMNYVGQRNSVLEDGKGARFAKFNTPYDGLSATVNQLLRYYDGKTTGSKLQTVEDIIKTWAPSSDNNNTSGYIKRVADEIGVLPSQTLDLRDPSVMKALMHAMSKVEIEKPLPYSDSLIMAAINGTGDPYVNAANNLKSFNDYISKPLLPNIMPDIKQTLGQSDALRASAQSVNNNRVEATINGGINIHTSSSTVSGNLSDALETANEMMFQLIAPMS